MLAKEVASVDLASNGRVIFGIGGGWNLEEMENHGTIAKSRWKLLRERVEAIKALWTKDEASYHRRTGEFRSGLVLAQAGAEAASPILLGSHGPHGMRRVIRYADGWMPNAGPGSKFRSRWPSCTN